MKSAHHYPQQKMRRDRTFKAMAAAYSMGVFNDNFFKQSAMLLAIGAGLTQLQGTATIVFALPFILCSAYAGWLADRFPKKNVVVHGKILECIAMLIGAVGIMTSNWLCILSMVFLMGLQSAIFGPALNGSIPEHFAGKEVLRINGMLKMITTAAVLVGIACAGFALDLQGEAAGSINPAMIVISVIIILVSLGGLIASLGIKKHQAAAPDKSFPWSGPFQSLAHLWSLRRDPKLLLAVCSDAYFYFLATLVVLIINTLGIEQLQLSQSVTSLLSVALMIGIALGAVFSARITDTANWQKVLVPGVVGMGVGLLAVAGAAEIFRMYLLFASLFFTGFCGGFFLIPITSFIQVHPAEEDKGQVIAVVGFCSFIGILLAGQLFSFANKFMVPATMMAWAGLFSLFVAAIYLVSLRWGIKLAKSVLYRGLARVLSLRYTVEVKGLAAISPDNEKKGILFLPNHPALIDPVIVMAILGKRFQPRPLADHDQANRLYLRPLMGLISAIQIPSLVKNGRSSKNGIVGAIKAVSAALRQGDNVILYPAGRLYRSKHEELGANSAVQTIVEVNPEQRLVLVRTKGLWGSSFSWSEGNSPSPLKGWWNYLRFVLANGLLFGPKRKVLVEFSEPAEFPRNQDKMAINSFLEGYYNEGAPALSQVPYYWWQGAEPTRRPDPHHKNVAPHTSHVPAPVKEQVLAYIREATGVTEMQEDDILASDLGMDSLTIMELATWLQHEFGVAIDNLDSLQSVGDCLLAACGQLLTRDDDGPAAIPGQWFAGKSDNTLSLAKSKTIAEAFLDTAKKNANKCIVADQLSGVKSYRQMIMAILVLQKKFADLADPSLGIMLPASVTASTCNLATMFSGKVPVMLNWTVGESHMGHCLQTAGVKRVITARALLEKLKGQGMDLSAVEVEWLYLEDLRQHVSLVDKILAFAQSHLSWSALSKAKISDTAAILFTSGSEAKPKAVPLSHANILANINGFTDVLSIQANDRLLGMLPPFHSLGLAGNIIMPLCLGLPTTYHPNPTEGGRLAGVVEQYKASLLIATPTFLHAIIRAAGPGQLESLRLVFTGAEKCPDYVYDAVGEDLPQAILCEGYGITECSPVVSVNSPENPQPGTIGRILPGMEAIIVDPENHELVESGRQGILLVRGENVFSGYLGNGVNSPFIRVIGKDWYNTGDLVKEGGQGVLTFCGRIKRFVKIGGEMISLPAIESALQQYFPLSKDGAPLLAVEATNAETMPEVVLFATFAVERHEVNSCLRKAGLSALHNIRRLVQVEEIPVLGTGKTDYQQLKAVLA